MITPMMTSPVTKKRMPALTPKVLSMVSKSTRKSPAPHRPATLALPPLTQLLIGSDLQKARYLYLPSVGFCLLLAALTQHLKMKSQWIVSIAIIAFNLAALFHNMTAWEYASKKAQAACSVAASCGVTGTAGLGLPGSLNGVYFFANGFPECVEMHRNGDVATQSSCVLAWDASTDELTRR